MDTKSPASTNGANQFMLPDPIIDIQMVPIPLNIDTEMAVWFERQYATLNELTSSQLLAELENLALEADVPSTTVELDAKTRSIVHQSATSAYAEYRTFMVSRGERFRPYNQWLALATPIACAMYALHLAIDEKLTILQTTA